MFVLHWDRLQKLDLTAEEIGTASKRLSMAPLGHIRVVRLKSERGLTLWVPKQASWGYLSLECKLTMDLDFEDISTFGKTLIELRLIFGGFHGGKLGSDVLLSLNLMKQGFKRVQDSYSVQKKRKCLIIRRRKYKPPAQSVHDTCICGACVVCLKKAGIMHDHFPGKNPAASDPSPVLSGSAAAGVYPYDRSYERVDHLDDDLGGHDVYECDCYHCTAQREAEEEEDEEDDYEEEDENELAYYYHRRGY
ncbi:hypothetical protein CVIRNUC_006684 [Coccomyxa viridis]|uniref:Uncharacterized protein n=1 Tax=Coccomyxa viridis TaxID=1274662 RepID=A0AAV1IBS9_9CHLO|nr:hypothetical protein CVIRNUC_006684 [Coccomyxa viridis]